MKKKYKILGRTVKVKAVKNKYISSGLLGEYFPSDEIAEVDPGFKEEEVRMNSYHEIGHAFARITGLSQIISNDAEEMFSENLALFLEANFDPKK